MSDIIETSMWPNDDTLASWIVALRPDSPCFCCGSPLRVPLISINCGEAVPARLTCSRCGAEVSCDEVAETFYPEFQGRKMTLAAA